MLQVRVHDRDVTRLAREHALEASAGEAAPADTANAAHAAVAFAGPRAPRPFRPAIVVDEQHFPVAAGETCASRSTRIGMLAAFVEGRHDDAEFRRRQAPLGRGRKLVGAVSAERRLSGGIARAAAEAMHRRHRVLAERHIVAGNRVCNRL